MYFIGIRYLIPLLFALFAILEGVLSYYTGIKDAVELTKESTLQEFRVDLTRIQGIIEILSNSDNLGTLRLYIASMAISEGHQLSLYVDSKGTVVSSTDLSLVGVKFNKLPYFIESDLAQKIAKNKMGVVSFEDGERENILRGYIGVCDLGRGYTTRNSKCGFFYHEFDISLKVENAKNITLQQFFNNLIGIFAILIFLIVIFQMGFSRRVNDLISTLKNISAGDENIRATVKGRDELSSIAVAFNVMLDRINDSKQRLAQSQKVLNQTQKEIQIITEKRLSFNEVLVDLSQRTFDSLPDVYATLNEVCVDLLEVSNASIWRFSEDEQRLTCEDFYYEKINKHQHGTLVAAPEISYLHIQLHTQGKLELNEKDYNCEEQKPLLKSIAGEDAISALIVPVWLEGVRIGIVCCALHDENRSWDDDEVDFLSRMASRITQFIETDERNSAEQALRIGEARLAEAQRIGRMGNWYWDIPQNTLRWSEETYRILGYQSDEFEPSYELFMARVHSEDRPELELTFNDALLNGESYFLEHRMIRPDGEEIVVEEIGQVQFDSNDKPLAMDGVIKDITERKRDENKLKVLFSQLQESEEKYRLIFELSEEPMWIQVMNKFVSANQAAVTMLGYDSEQQMINTHPAELSPEYQLDGKKSLEKANEMYALAYKQGHNRFEWMHKKRNGEVFPVEVSLTRVSYEGREALFCLWHDLTERKALEQQLSRQKDEAEAATRAKSEFLANMSHEIRTPMNAIINLSYLAQNDKLPAITMDYLHKIEHSGKNLLGILNDILDLSKIEAQKLELDLQPFNLYKLLQDMAVVSGGRTLKRSVDLLFDLASDVPSHLIGDSLRLRQVITNLISNAMKFTKKGEVVLKVELLSVEAPWQTLRFCVEDSGIGISDDQLSRLFESFVQADGTISRRYGGTGLGLSISKHLVEMMGGDISVKSRLGVGSVFSFTCRLKLDQTEAGDSGNIAELSHIKVLVVDDNPAVQRVMHDVLSRYNIQSYVVAGADDAIDALKKSQGDVSTHYDLVIVDWMMPSVNGLQLIQRIRQNFTHKDQPKIILLTSYGGSNLENEKRAEGIDGFIEKPFTPCNVLDVISQVMSINPPALPLPQTQKGVLKDKKYPELAGHKVLIVDDNPINLQIIEELLNRVGIEVVAVDSANKGYRILDEKNIDVVLMDIQMPTIDGLEATQYLRQEQRFSELPILALTANAMPADIEKSRIAGMNDHLVKPISPEVLYSTLKKWLIDNKNVPGSGEKASIKLKMPEKLVIPEEVINRQKGLSYLAGNEDKYNQLLAMFCENYCDAVEKVKHLSEQNDWLELNRLAHSIKSVSATLGAERLSFAAEKLEHDAAANKIDDGVFHEFSEILKQVVDELRKGAADNQQSAENVEHIYNKQQALSLIEELKTLCENDVSLALERSRDLTTVLSSSAFKGEGIACSELLSRFDIDAYKVELGQLADLVRSES